MGFTKPQIIELFPQVTEEQLNKVLADMEFDPDTEYYADEVVVGIEEALGIVKQATRQLLEGEKTGKIEVQETAELIHQQLVQSKIGIPVKSLMYLLQSSIKDAQLAADVISQATITAFATQLEQGQDRATEAMLEGIQEHGVTMRTMFSPQNIQRLVEAATTKREKIDLNAFLEVNREIEGQRSLASAPQTVESKVFDLEAFILEVNQ